MFKHQRAFLAFEINEVRGPGAPTRPQTPQQPQAPQQVQDARQAAAGPDGQLSRQEYVDSRASDSGLTGQALEQAKAQYQREFDSFNANEDNNLDLGEFTNLIQARLGAEGSVDLGARGDAGNLDAAGTAALTEGTRGITERGAAVTANQNRVNAWLQSDSGRRWAQSPEGQAALGQGQQQLATDGLEGPRTRAAMAAMAHDAHAQAFPAEGQAQPAAATPPAAPAGGAAPAAPAQPQQPPITMAQINGAEAAGLDAYANAASLARMTPEVRGRLLDRMIEARSGVTNQNVATVVTSLMGDRASAAELTEARIGKIPAGVAVEVGHRVFEAGRGSPEARAALLANIGPDAAFRLAQRAVENSTVDVNSIRAVTMLATPAAIQNPSRAQTLIDRYSRMSGNREIFARTMVENMSAAQLRQAAHASTGAEGLRDNLKYYITEGDGGNQLRANIDAAYQ